MIPLSVRRPSAPTTNRREEGLGLCFIVGSTRVREGQVALIIGEPGVSKSRLVAESHDRIRGAPHIWMESTGERFLENTPFHAIIETLLPAARTAERRQMLSRRSSRLPVNNGRNRSSCESR